MRILKYMKAFWTLNELRINGSKTKYLEFQNERVKIVLDI